MSFCSGCGKKNTKTRFVNPITKRCNECPLLTNTMGTNNFPSQNALNTSILPNSGTNPNDGMNSYYLNSSQYRNNTDDAVAGSNISESNINTFLNKPTNELTVADIIRIHTISNEPLKQQLDLIQDELGCKIKNLDNRVDILDSQNMKLQDDNNVLRGVITSMQQCLNKLDNDERNKNIIISGIPEENVAVNDNIPLTNDHEKISQILHLTENRYFNDDSIKNLNISRIGAERKGYNRFVKIILPSINDRNEFLKNAVKLKSSPAPWSKIFIKKDQHPVYLAENNRIRKKAYDLKKMSGNENKEIKVVNGKILVDNITVDQNLFFH